MADSVSELMQQAIARHGRGALDDASRLYNHVLRREPEHCDALHLLGVVAHQQGRDEDAVALISRAIARSPAAPAFRNNLGMALTALGRTREAETAYQEALALAPDFPDAMLNLGNLRAGQGRLDEALTLLEKAVALEPNAPEGYYNLGWARFTAGDRRGALDALNRAVSLGADFAEAHCRVGRVRLSLGDVADAVDCFRRALDRDGDHLGAQHGLLDCLDGLPADADASRLEQVVGPLLRATSVNPRSFGHAAARWLERKYRLGTDSGRSDSPEQVCDRILDDEIVRLYLRRAINVSAPLERLLGRCRARWLDRARGTVAVPPSRWRAVGAVAIQCFLNEFVWTAAPEEERAVDELERIVNKELATATALDDESVSNLLVYACYRPLWRINGAAQLSAISTNAPAALEDFLRVCLREPLRELDLRSRVASGRDIRDGVSRAVQAQYEENPYPRWLTITRGDAQDIEQRVRRWCPGYVAPGALRGALRVLVAGCGTGIEAIDVALHLKRADVTAVDLSRASLAYAMRKAGEYGIGNIRFRQEDILRMERNGDAYHVINCTGVLHHMRDPAVGLARLAELLVPGGLIKLALYSRLAREPLVEAREFIRSSGIFGSGEHDIRAFRRQVLEGGADGALAELTGSTDFFSLSECRDLLFHVHEVQFDLPGIRRLLEKSGLEFLGFELAIPEVEQGFRREHADAELSDLRAWEAYEQRHPESFRSMYHFWCRKPDA